MIGFKLNSAGDIEASNGKISLLSTIQEAVRQRLEIKLRTFQNEWFLDTTYGIPYRQQIIGKGSTQKEVDAIYIAAINEDPDVQRIVFFNSTYNSFGRLYDLDFEVLVADELLRVSTANQTPAEEIEYPEPDHSALQPSCDAVVIGRYGCELHQIVHCELPICGEYTWIYDEEGMYSEPYYTDWGYFTNNINCTGEDCIEYYEAGYAQYDYVGYDCEQSLDVYRETISYIFPSQR